MTVNDIIILTSSSHRDAPIEILRRRYAAGELTKESWSNRTRPATGFPRMCLVQLGVWLTKAYGVSLDLADRHPWESIHRYLANRSFPALYWGFAYLSVGEAPGASAFKDLHVRADLEGR